MTTTPMFSRSASSTLMGKCTEHLKVPVPEALKEQLAALAVLRGKCVAEYVRDLLVAHVHGALYSIRLRQEGAE